MTATAVSPARTVETLCRYLGLLNGAAPLYRSALRVAAEVRDRPAFGEPFARERLAVEERAAGPDHRDVAIAVAALAALLDAQDRIDEAEPLYRALRIFRRHPQRDGAEMAVTLAGLAAIRHAKGHPSEAARLYHRALVIRRRLLPAGHPAIAATLHSLAVLLDSQGHHARAARLIRTAMTSEWRSARARRLEGHA
ncbi:MAG TPA: tetratricopeptide repeat protein [Polyangia bacterium]|nr:tetratricopeptide repeat protein [Polyangia bacterium]